MVAIGGDHLNTMPTMNVAQLTYNQPFCAGVLILHNNTLLITLNSDGVPHDALRSVWRIGGVGGGQEPGETVWECALREAEEEIGTKVELIHCPITLFHDIDSKSLEQVQIRDELAPFLFERKRNVTPNKPYKPGLPIGPYVYFNLFLAKVLEPDEVFPSDDVQALVFMPIESWELLRKGITAYELRRLGIRIITRVGFDVHRELWLPPHESFDTVVQLVRDDPFLQERLARTLNG